MDKLF